MIKTTALTLLLTTLPALAGEYEFGTKKISSLRFLAAMTRAGKAKIQLIYKYLIGWDKKLKHSKNHSDSISNNKVITSNQI